MKKKLLNIGLDIGITSVGWSLIDEDNNLIDLGVRLFDDPANPKDAKLGNVERREARSQRRRIRRIRHRKTRLLDFFVDNNLVKDHDSAYKILEAPITNYSQCKNPVEIKVKALNETISNEELIIILFHYIHHRGYSYLTQEMEIDEKVKESKKYPSEQMLDFYKEHGYYIGSPLSINFSKWDYWNEINQILIKQNKTDKFIKDYEKLFMKIRDFSEGPGSEKSPTPFGLWRIENGKLKKIGDNLWDTTIGECSFCKGELRGGKNSPIAELYNLFNDLNNLYFFQDKENKLTIDDKRKLFDSINESIIKLKKKNITIKQIKKLKEKENINDDEEVVYGYRNDGKLTELNNLCDIAIFLLKQNIINTFNIYNNSDVNLVNDFFEILRKNPSDLIKQKQSIEYSNAFKKIKSDDLDGFLRKIKGLSATHSLSYKAMMEYIEYAKNENGNQRIYFDNYFKKENDDEEKSKYIKKDSINNMIISPTTKRSLIQSINVLNKIFKLYSKNYEINNITIEMPREKNSADERKKITDMNKKRESKVKEAKDNFGIDLKNSKDRLKFILWEEQDHKDIYTGESILLEELINNPNLYDVDHIIPYSICFMDGRKNKVLTKKENNSEKSNQSPYQWLGSKGKYEDFKSRVLQLYEQKKISRDKKELLLFEKDPVTDMQDFIARNLVDTRYASSELLHHLQVFKKVNNDLYPNMKIKVINGSVTDYVRYGLIKIPKDRDEYHHHAIDATLVNFLGNNNKIDRLCTWTSQLNKKLKREGKIGDKHYIKVVDHETSEVLSLSDDMKEEFSSDNIIANLKKQILNKIDNNEIKFSRQLVTKKNIKLSDETIYSIKQSKVEDKKGEKIIYHLVNKINLLESENKDLSKYFGDKPLDAQKLFVYKWDKKMYDILNSIYNTYIKLDTKKNVFLQYMIDQYDDEKPKNIKINNQLINKLRILGDEKNLDQAIVLKSHNNKAIMQSLKPLGFYICKNSKDKYITVPINQKVLKYSKGSLEIDNNKLNNYLKNNDIDVNSNKILIKSGTILISKENNKLFYFNGGGQLFSNYAEIKSLFCINDKIFPRKQMNVSISTIIRDYDICEVDVLGNIYNRRSIVL